MIHYKELGFVTYAVIGMARARKFYEGVLGLKSNGFARVLKGAKFIEYTVGSSGTLAIGSSPAWKPSRDGAVVALEVVDFDATLAHLKRHRIKFAMGPTDGPMCRMVVVRDPDGNKLALHHRKRKSEK